MRPADYPIPNHFMTARWGGGVCDRDGALQFLACRDRTWGFMATANPIKEFSDLKRKEWGKRLHTCL